MLSTIVRSAWTLLTKCVCGICRARGGHERRRDWSRHSSEVKEECERRVGLLLQALLGPGCGVQDFQLLGAHGGTGSHGFGYHSGMVVFAKGQRHKRNFDQHMGRAPKPSSFVVLFQPLGEVLLRASGGQAPLSTRLLQRLLLHLVVVFRRLPVCRFGMFRSLGDSMR